MKRETLEWLACMLVASIGLVACLWVVPYIPTADGPQHVFSAHVENHYADAGSPYPDYYRILPQFGGKGFALVFGPLESILPWRLALRVALSLMALAFAWGFASVALALDRRRRSTALLGFFIALPWSLYMGFFAFVVGVTVGLYILAYAIRRPPTTPARCALLAFLLLMQGVCHVFTAVMTGGVVAAIVVLGAPGGKRLAALGRMTLVGVPAAALLGATFLHRNIGPGDSGLEWELSSRPAEISRWFVAGPSFRGWLVMGLVIVGIGTTLARSRRSRDRSAARETAAMAPEVAIAWVALAFLLITALGPIHIPGWQLFAPRFAVLAAVLGLALLRLPERASPRLLRAVMAVVTASCLGSNLLSAKLHHRLADGCAALLAALDVPLHFEGPRWPILLNAYCGAPEERADSPVPWAAMALNVNLLYLLDHGGIAAKLFNGAPSIHAIAVRGARMPRPPATYAQSVAVSQYFNDDPKVRTSTLNELAADGMRYEGIHVVGGRPDDFTVFRERGYVPEFQNDSLLIAHFEGCPSELLLPPGALDGEPVYFEYGLFSRFLMTAEPHVLFKMPIARDAPVTDGAIHVPLPGRPCGAVWVRVVWDADGSSSLTAGDHTCGKASSGGRRVETVSREHPAIRCAPDAAPP
jgi:hypothetical protein